MTQTRQARIIRQQRGKSLEDVSRVVRITFGHLARFERGLVGMGIGNLQKLAHFYGCTIDELVAEVEEEVTAS